MTVCELKMKYVFRVRLSNNECFFLYKKDNEYKKNRLTLMS